MEDIRDTVKVALADGKLFASTPGNLSNKAADLANAAFFDDFDGKVKAYAGQVKALRSMSGVESEWSAIVRSEQRVSRVLDEVDTGQQRLLLGNDEVSGRMELKLALHEAQAAGRLSISDATTQRATTLLLDDLPGIGVAKGGLYDLGSRAPHGYRPMSQRGFIDTEFLLGTPTTLKAFSALPTHIKLISAGATIATIADGADTYLDIRQLQARGNAAGAEDRIVRFAATSAGAWAGAMAGAGAAAVAGLGTGPGAIAFGAVGGIAGGIAGDKAADWIREWKINNQPDAQGNSWRFDPDNPAAGWVRYENEYASVGYGEALPSEIASTRVHADPATADYLNYKASVRSVEIALDQPPAGSNPYRLPVSASDFGQPAPLEVSRAWVRDAQTQRWQQDIQATVDRGTVTRVEDASPARAAQLEQQSQAVLAGNAQRTPAAMAAQFETAFKQNGWEKYGPLPEAVIDAKQHPERIVASDGALYSRSAADAWTHERRVLPDTSASGNTLHELETTYRYQQTNLRVTTLATVQARPDPSPTLAQPTLRQPTREPPAPAPASAADAPRTPAPEAPLPERPTAHIDTTARAQTRDASTLPSSALNTSTASTAAGDTRADATAHTTATTTTRTTPNTDDIRLASHPGNGSYQLLASRVDMFETHNGIQHGPHSERLAASLAALSTREQLDPQRLFLQRDVHGAIQLVQRTRFGEPDSAQVQVPIDAQALGAQPIDVSSRAHAAALSHHYAVVVDAQRREAAQRERDLREDDRRERDRREGDRYEGEQREGDQRDISRRQTSHREASREDGGIGAAARGTRVPASGSDTGDADHPLQRSTLRDPLAALNANDRALFERIRQDVPASISDAHVAQTLLLGKQHHINSAADIERVAVVGDRILLMGTMPTGAARVACDASQPAQALETTLAQTQAHSLQRDQQQLAAQQVQQHGSHAR